MPMLACIHYVSWVVPIDGGKHQCLYCRETVSKKDIYPKFRRSGRELFSQVGLADLAAGEQVLPRARHRHLAGLQDVTIVGK